MVAITLTPKVKNIDKLLAHCHRRRYTAKSTIIYQGDRCESLFYIVKGSVTILIEDDDGREMIIAYLNAGDFFGEMGLFEKEAARRNAVPGFAPRPNAKWRNSATRSSAN